MSSANPPQNPEKFTITLFGMKRDLMTRIGNAILNHNTLVETQNDFVMGENDSFKIIITPDFFEEECPHLDQQIIDLMALSDSGVHLFILATNSENTLYEIVQQISRLDYVFRKTITEHLRIIVENNGNFSLLTDLESCHKIQLETDSLADQCKKWCVPHQTFQFDNKDYSERVVDRRKYELKRTSDYNYCFRNKRRPLCNPGTTGEVFNIILIGSTGTGKSASANTILNAGKHQLNSNQRFASQPSPLPVTTKCEEKIVKLFGTQVRVVDTPDFFYEDEPVEESLKQCRKYCQPGQCVVLLVIQLGRFTESERGILDKLEKKLGWRIRDSTIVLFTHGEDLQGIVERFVGERSHLKHIVEACDNRYHIFMNTSKDTKQVTELIKKFPAMFPIPTNELSSQQCCLC